MKEIIKNNLIELLSIVVVFIDLFYTIIPPLPLVFIFIVISIFRTGAVGGFVLSSWAIPKLLGSAIYLYGLTGVATILQLFMFSVCLFLWLGKRTIRFNNFKSGFLLLILVLSLFSISSLVTSGGDYAIIKIKDTIIAGTVTFFAYGFMLSNIYKCNFVRIGLYLLLFSILMLLISPLLNHGVGPENLFDFGYLRLQNTYVLNEDELLIDYQHVGFAATMGVGVLLLESLKKKPNVVFTVLCILLCILISLYSGARQFMVTSIVILIMWILMTRNKSFVSIIFLLLSLIFVSALIVYLTSMEGLLGSVQEEGYLDASGRSMHLIKGINDFLENPIFGIGYGRFSLFGEYGGYPHNMFVEILCELGVVGFLILTILIFKPMIYLLKFQKPCIYLMMVFFLRSMASGGLDSNIMFFSFVFAVLCLKPLQQRKNIGIIQNSNVRPSYEG
jgi:O-antigen ligase